LIAGDIPTDMILRIPEHVPAWSVDRSFVTINTMPREPNDNGDDEYHEGDEGDGRDDEPPVVRELDE
jgi:hypothetical protein